MPTPPSPAAGTKATSLAARAYRQRAVGRQPTRSSTTARAALINGGPLVLLSASGQLSDVTMLICSLSCVLKGLSGAVTAPLR